MDDAEYWLMVDASALFFICLVPLLIIFINWLVVRWLLARIHKVL